MKQTMPFLLQRGATGVAVAAVWALAAEVVAAGTFAFGTAAMGQSFPVNPPTSLPVGNALTAPIAATSGVRVAAHRAQVSFAAGMLDVQANNSSLNQILRDIARSTGMKITGAVAEQRVFGNYGPAKPSTVIATLLDGAGVNMLLREGSGEAPLELVLTQRTGGPTPPDPNASGFDEGPAEEQAPLPVGQPRPPQGFPGQAQPPLGTGTGTGLPVTQQPTATQQAPPTALQQVPATAQPSDGMGGAGSAAAGTAGVSGTSGPQPIPATLNNVNGSSLNTSPTASTLPTTNSVPSDSVNTPVTTPPSSGIVDAPNPAAPGSTTAPASPNGVKTPDQIYQQLLQMQQQNKKPSS